MRGLGYRRWLAADGRRTELRFRVPNVSMRESLRTVQGVAVSAEHSDVRSPFVLALISRIRCSLGEAKMRIEAGV